MTQKAWEHRLGFIADNIIGMCVDDAHVILSEFGVSYRVVERNGHRLTVTRDHKIHRMNLAIVGAIITEVHFG